MKHILSLITPIHEQGFRFIAIFAGISFILFFISNILGWIGILATCWCAFFFRDPKRFVPQQEGLIVAPADGVVSAIQKAKSPPKELGLGAEKRVRISIFMSIFNAHINRVPHKGVVRDSFYHRGQFLNAERDKSSDENERSSLIIELPDGRDLIVVQIAGLIARRIVCWVKKGDALETGEKFGLIRFGSRVDVYLPEHILPKVAVGQLTIAGETILADLDAQTSSSISFAPI